MYATPHLLLTYPVSSPRRCYTCMQAVPYSMSLATIKKFIWKRSDDVVFHYRTLDPARLAPFPTFQLPEA